MTHDKPFPRFISDDNRDEVAEYIRNTPLGRAYRLDFKPISQRTKEQNDKFHAMLHDIARDAQWCGKKLKWSQWKRLFVAVVKEQEMLPGLEGGVVVVSDNSSSELPPHLFSDMIEYLYAWGNDHEVNWTEPMP